jgi:hypothetical protein
MFLLSSSYILKYWGEIFLPYSRGSTLLYTPIRSGPEMTELAVWVSVKIIHGGESPLNSGIASTEELGKNHRDKQRVLLPLMVRKLK